MTQNQPVFGPASQQSVRFLSSLSHQIVNHDPNVGIRPAKDKRPFTLSTEAGVDAGDQALAGRLFIPGRPVCLTGRVEVLN